jgi:ketosteroid isomerase-like protein
MQTAVAQESQLAVLTELNRGYVRAVQESDVAWFEKNLAAEFFNTNPDCSLVDRSGFLERIAKSAGISGLREEDVRIRVFGDFAIIHAKTVYIKADGTPGSGRYTDIWARTQGRWLCVAAHVNRA